MNPAGASLWRESGAWRWLLTGALLFGGLGLLGAPWRPDGPPPAVAGGSYKPPPANLPGTAPMAPPQRPTLAGMSGGRTSSPPSTTAAPSATTAATPPSAGGQADAMLSAAPPMPPAASTMDSRSTGTGARQSTSNVVWASGSGMMPGSTISGGGLIAAYCCAGAFSTAWANRGVTSGKHYWELTLSTQPGEQTAASWTEAGIAPRAPVDSGRVKVPARHGNEELAVRPGRDPSIRNGDVLMFALDADQKLGYWGVNGQWRNGTPGSAGGQALPLKAGEQFFPFGTLSARSDKTVPEGDRWIANFGGQKFRYAMPSGFDAYATGGGGAVLAAMPPQLAAVPATPAPPAGPDSQLGKWLQGSASVSGQTVPLPDGRWLVLAHFKGSANTPGDSLLLGQPQGRDLPKMVAIHANRGARAKNATFRSCLRQDVFYQSNQEARPDAPTCWWVNHATAVWDLQPLFKAAQLELAQRGVQAAAVYVNVGFYRSDADGFATTFYYFDPAASGIASQTVPWAESEWHKSRIDMDPQRAAFAQKMADWGRGWAPIYFATR